MQKESIEKKLKLAIEYLHCLKSLDYVDINIAINELLKVLEDK